MKLIFFYSRGLLCVFCFALGLSPLYAQALPDNEDFMRAFNTSKECSYLPEKPPTFRFPFFMGEKLEITLKLENTYLKITHGVQNKTKLQLNFETQQGHYRFRHWDYAKIAKVKNRLKQKNYHAFFHFKDLNWTKKNPQKSKHPADIFKNLTTYGVYRAYDIYLSPSNFILLDTLRHIEARLLNMDAHEKKLSQEEKDLLWNVLSCTKALLWTFKENKHSGEDLVIKTP